MRLFKRIYKIFRFYLILLGRAIQVLLRRKRRKASFQVKPISQVIFRNSFLVLEFESKNLLFVSSSPGYRSLDLKRMYLDMTKINCNEIVVTGHGIRRNIDVVVALNHIVEISLPKRPSVFSHSLFSSNLEARSVELRALKVSQRTQMPIISRNHLESTIKPVLKNRTPVLAPWQDLNAEP